MRKRESGGSNDSSNANNQLTAAATTTTTPTISTWFPNGHAQSTTACSASTENGSTDADADDEEDALGLVGALKPIALICFMSLFVLNSIREGDNLKKMEGGDNKSTHHTTHHHRTLP